MTVHFNESGEPLGTGDVTLKRKDANKMLNDFKGVNLDGLRFGINQTIPPIRDRLVGKSSRKFLFFDTDFAAKMHQISDVLSFNIS